eukprot:11696411-Alexandrium_andersonii.AAC.1
MHPAPTAGAIWTVREARKAKYLERADCPHCGTPDSDFSHLLWVSDVPTITWASQQFRAGGRAHRSGRVAWRCVGWPLHLMH